MCAKAATDLESPEGDPTMLPRPHPAVVFNSVSEGAVLLHTESEVYFGLNRVGAQVWELLPSCDGVEELCERVGDRYPDATAEQIRNDVVELLDVLEEADLVVRP